LLVLATGKFFLTNEEHIYLQTTSKGGVLLCWSRRGYKYYSRAPQSVTRLSLKFSGHYAEENKGRKIFSTKKRARTKIKKEEEMSAASSQTGGGDSLEDDEAMMLMMGEGGEPGDEGMKKKQQNSVRWKRWWLKNREAYNEKRRVSAQLRSAKNRANREKQGGSTVTTTVAQQQPTTTSSAKRIRRSTHLPTSSVPVSGTPLQDIRLPSVVGAPKSMISPTNSSSSITSLASTNSAGGGFMVTPPMSQLQPSISPAHGFRSALPSLPLLGGFSPQTAAVLNALNSQHPPHHPLLSLDGGGGWNLPLSRCSSSSAPSSSNRLLPSQFFPQFSPPQMTMNPFMFGGGGGGSGLDATFLGSSNFSNIMSRMPGGGSAPLQQSMYLSQ
jgi:hypothetical protein